MVDYQYDPDPEDRVTKLRMAMENFDGSYFSCFIGALADLTSGGHPQL